ncbi:MAG: radical SAM protein, partial [Bacteroidota bacterium]
QSLKRVYYSGYVPISDDNRLPTLSAPPLRRENRLYQADWLMRFYGFRATEIVDAANPMLDPDLDPKLAYALRNPSLFPVDVNTAPLEMILRIPGVGVKSARKIVQSRRFRPLRREHLKKIGIVWKRAQYFLLCADKDFRQLGFDPGVIRRRVLSERSAGGRHVASAQLSLFG